MARPESVYWIGGVPCSGKTPIPRALAELGNASVYHLDEHHDRHIENTTPETHPAWRFPGRDQYLALPPTELADLYMRECHERFSFAVNDLLQMHGACVIADGASFLPELLDAAGVGSDHAAFINVTTETRGTRWRNQRTDERKEYLGCYEDPDAAWETWMKRDEILAERIAAEARQLGMLVVTADSGISHEDVVNAVAIHFGWKEGPGLDTVQ